MEEKDWKKSIFNKKKDRPSEASDRENDNDEMLKKLGRQVED